MAGFDDDLQNTETPTRSFDDDVGSVKSIFDDLKSIADDVRSVTGNAVQSTAASSSNTGVMLVAGAVVLFLLLRK